MQLSLQSEKMTARSIYRQQYKGYEDHTKYFDEMLTYQKEIFEKGLVDAVIDTDKPIEDIGKEIQRYIENAIRKQFVTCPGCGVRLYSENTSIDKDFNASAACRELCYALSYYTLSLHDNYFIHQIVVDTYAAQHSGERVKSITTAFALVGLYLVSEKGYTGKQVQQIHLKLANANPSKVWPQFSMPKENAALTVKNVVQSVDEQKQEMIHKWCQSVWDIWKGEEGKVNALLGEYVKFK